MAKKKYAFDLTFTEYQTDFQKLQKFDFQSQLLVCLFFTKECHLGERFFKTLIFEALGFL